MPHLITLVAPSLGGRKCTRLLASPIYQLKASHDGAAPRAFAAGHPGLRSCLCRLTCTTFKWSAVSCDALGCARKHASRHREQEVHAAGLTRPQSATTELKTAAAMAVRRPTRSAVALSGNACMRTRMCVCQRARVWGEGRQGKEYRPAAASTFGLQPLKLCHHRAHAGPQLRQPFPAYACPTPFHVLLHAQGSLC